MEIKIIDNIKKLRKKMFWVNELTAERLKKLLGSTEPAVDPWYSLADRLTGKARPSEKEYREKWGNTPWKELAMILFSSKPGEQLTKSNFPSTPENWETNMDAIEKLYEDNDENLQ